MHQYIVVINLVVLSFLQKGRTLWLLYKKGVLCFTLIKRVPSLSAKIACWIIGGGSSQKYILFNDVNLVPSLAN